MSDIIDAKTLVTLQQLQIYALKQKSRILAGGDAIPEQNYPDEPQLDDFDNQTPDTSDIDMSTAGLDAIMPLPTPKPQATIIAPTQPTNKVGKTLAEQIAERKQQAAHADNQITIDEAVAAADQAAVVQPSAPAPTMTQSPASATCKQTMQNIDVKPSRLREYHEARVAWRIERWRRKYEDARLKKQALDLTAGYDDMINYIDKIINDSRKRDASRIDDVNID